MESVQETPEREEELTSPPVDSAANPLVGYSTSLPFDTTR